MKKTIALALIALLVCPAILSAKEIKLTTYYPAPYGEYQDLKAKRMKVGSGQVPATEGVINFGGLNSDPAPAAPQVNRDGDLYYNATNHVFRYFDGSASSGAGAWKNLGSVDAASLNQNGYTKLPSGLIIQWGSIAPTTTAHKPEYDFGTISFPIPFPNRVFSVVATIFTNEDEGYTEGSAAVANLTNTGFSLYEVTPYNPTSAYDDTAGANWMAVGY